MTAIGVRIGQFIERKHAEQERIRLLACEHVARAESEAAQQRFAFLAEASSALAASLDYEAALARVVGLAVPYLADWCAVDVVEDGGALRRLAIAHADAAKASGRWRSRRYPTPASAAIGAPAVVRSGEPQLVPEITDVMLREAAQSEEHLLSLHELEPRSRICVPLIARGRTLGALTFVVGESGRRYGEADLGLAVDSRAVPLPRSTTRASTEPRRSAPMPRACSPTSATGCSSSTPRVSCDSGTRRPRQSLGFPAPTSSGGARTTRSPAGACSNRRFPWRARRTRGGRAATLRLELPDRSSGCRSRASASTRGSCTRSAT